LDMLHARWPDQAAALREKLALDDEELADWRDAIARIVTGLDPATGIYEQFAGFHTLEPVDLAEYADRTVPMDVVIGRERTQRSQVIKQADVVALIALLPEEFPERMAEINFRHYEPRCGHGSSLSAGMHALVAARLGDTELAIHYLRETAATDLDLDPNSAGGVRIAGLGALWQAVILGFAGLDMMHVRLGLDPRPRPHGAAFPSECAGEVVAWQFTLLAGPCKQRCWRASRPRCLPGIRPLPTRDPRRIPRSGTSRSGDGRQIRIRSPRRLRRIPQR
jgi:trehalose/maltose hydrolase-like predicted phosphorylase